jgi:hypothetical protein
MEKEKKSHAQKANVRFPSNGIGKNMKNKEMKKDTQRKTSSVEKTDGLV